MEQPMPITTSAPTTPVGGIAYANGVEVWLSGVGEMSFKFIFASKRQQLKIAPFMIVGTPYMAKVLRDICTEMVNDYEAVFGEIKTGRPELSEGLFKFNTKLGGTPDAPTPDDKSVS